MKKSIDLIYRANGCKGASDGGKIRNACKTVCEAIEYSVAGISAHLVGLDDEGKVFLKNCPADCTVEIIGGDPGIYQSEVLY
jgi:hypothetical protein